MGEEWTHSAPQRPWVDTETQFDRYVGSFQRLLQSGDRQYYLVQDAAGGEPITPCLYLGDLLDEEFERFSDLDSVEHRRRPRSITQDSCRRDSLSLRICIDRRASS